MSRRSTILLLAVVALLAAGSGAYQTNRAREQMQTRARAVESGRYRLSGLESTVPRWLAQGAYAIDAVLPEDWRMDIDAWSCFGRVTEVDIDDKNLATPLNDVEAFSAAEKVSFKSSTLHPEVFRQLAQFRRLQHLDISSALVTPEDFRSLSQLSSDTTLHLNEEQCSEANLKELRFASRVNGLMVNTLNWDKASQRALRYLPNLKSLQFYGGPGSTWETVGTEDLKILVDLKLTTLNLGLAEVTDEQVAVLAQIPLTELHLNGKRLTKKGFESLGGIKTVRRLYLSEAVLGRDDLEPLTRLPLTDLALEGCTLLVLKSDAFTRFPMLTNLTLDYSPGTLEVLPQLAGHPRLEKIVLGDHRFDPGHAEMLATCPKLRFVEISRQGDLLRFVETLNVLRPEVEVTGHEGWSGGFGGGGSFF